MPPRSLPRALLLLVCCLSSPAPLAGRAPSTSLAASASAASSPTSPSSAAARGDALRRENEGLRRANAALLLELFSARSPPPSSAAARHLRQHRHQHPHSQPHRQRRRRLHGADADAPAAAGEEEGGGSSEEGRGDYLSASVREGLKKAEARKNDARFEKAIGLVKKGKLPQLKRCDAGFTPCLSKCKLRAEECLSLSSNTEGAKDAPLVKVDAASVSTIRSILKGDDKSLLGLVTGAGTDGKGGVEATAASNIKRAVAAVVAADGKTPKAAGDGNNEGRSGGLESALAGARRPGVTDGLTEEDAARFLALGQVLHRAAQTGTWTGAGAVLNNAFSSVTRPLGKHQRRRNGLTSRYQRWVLMGHLTPAAIAAQRGHLTALDRKRQWSKDADNTQSELAKELADDDESGSGSGSGSGGTSGSGSESGSGSGTGTGSGSELPRFARQQALVAEGGTAAAPAVLAAAPPPVASAAITDEQAAAAAGSSLSSSSSSISSTDSSLSSGSGDSSTSSSPSSTSQSSSSSSAGSGSSSSGVVEAAAELANARAVNVRTAHADAIEPPKNAAEAVAAKATTNAALSSAPAPPSGGSTSSSTSSSGSSTSTSASSSTSSSESGSGSASSSSSSPPSPQSSSSSKSCRKMCSSYGNYIYNSETKGCYCVPATPSSSSSRPSAASSSSSTSDDESSMSSSSSTGGSGGGSSSSTGSGTSSTSSSTSTSSGGSSIRSGSSSGSGSTSAADAAASDVMFAKQKSGSGSSEATSTEEVVGGAAAESDEASWGADDTKPKVEGAVFDEKKQPMFVNGGEKPAPDEKTERVVVKAPKSDDDDTEGEVGMGESSEREELTMADGAALSDDDNDEDESGTKGVKGTPWEESLAKPSKKKKKTAEDHRFKLATTLAKMERGEGGSAPASSASSGGGSSTPDGGSKRPAATPGDGGVKMAAAGSESEDTNDDSYASDEIASAGGEGGEKKEPPTMGVGMFGNTPNKDGDSNPARASSATPDAASAAVLDEKQMRTDLESMAAKNRDCQTLKRLRSEDDSAMVKMSADHRSRLEALEKVKCDAATKKKTKTDSTKDEESEKKEAEVIEKEAVAIEGEKKEKEDGVAVETGGDLRKILNDKDASKQPVAPEVKAPAPTSPLVNSLSAGKEANVPKVDAPPS